VGFVGGKIYVLSNQTLEILIGTFKALRLGKHASSLGAWMRPNRCSGYVVARAAAATVRSLRRWPAEMELVDGFHSFESFLRDP